MMPAKYGCYFVSSACKPFLSALLKGYLVFETLWIVMVVFKTMIQVVGVPGMG